VRRSVWKLTFVYLYKTYFAKSLLRKYCKEGASVVTHFGSPRKKRENTKKLLNEKIKNKKIKK